MISVDFFVVPTVRNQVLYVFLVLSNERRRVLHFNVTTNPTAEWTGRQLLEAFAWRGAPLFLLRDRDKIYGEAFSRGPLPFCDLLRVLSLVDLQRTVPEQHRSLGARRCCGPHIQAAEKIEEIAIRRIGLRLRTGAVERPKLDGRLSNELQNQELLAAR
jgi:hypothetical protein